MDNLPQDCPICLQTVLTDATKCVLRCNHSICNKCLPQLRTPNCPICRNPIFPETEVSTLPLQGFEDLLQTSVQELVEYMGPIPSEMIMMGHSEPEAPASVPSSPPSTISAESTEPLNSTISAESTEPLNSTISAESTEPLNSTIPAESAEPTEEAATPSGDPREGVERRQSQEWGVVAIGPPHVLLPILNQVMNNR